MDDLRESPQARFDEKTTRESVIDHVYKLFADLAICSCGNPESAYDLIRSLLALAPFHERSRADVADLIGTEGAYQLVLSQLTDAELIQHGVDISGSWLTPKGEWYLAALRTITDWTDLDKGDRSSIGFPHDEADCTDACWKVPIS